AAGSQADAGERLGQGADLVELDEDGVGDLALDAPLQALDVRHEDVVADELHAVADALGERLPAVPVVLRAAILDRDERVLLGEGVVDADELVPRDALLVEGVLAGLLVEELARGAVEGDEDVLAGLVARLFDG